MKKITKLTSAILVTLLASCSANAQQAVLPCYQVSGAPCQVVNSTHGLPVSIVGPISGIVNLGTSVSATSPRITGDATSGFYTAGAGLVDVSVSGSQEAEFSSTAIKFFDPVAIGTTSLTAGTALDLGTNTNSMLLPVGTTAQRPTGVNGMIRYNSTTPGFEGFANGAWGAIGGNVIGSPLNSAQIIVGSASNLAAAVTPSLDVSLANTGAFTVNSFGGGNVPGSGCAANTGTSGATIPFLNGANTWSALNTYTANVAVSGAAQVTLTTSASQGAAGIYVPYTNPTSLVAGSIVSGTNIVTGTQLLNISAGTTSTVVTIPVAVASGQTAIPVTTTASLSANQMLIDTTTPAATAGQNAIKSIVTGTTDLSTTLTCGTCTGGTTTFSVPSTTNLQNSYLIYDTTHTTCLNGAVVSSFVANTSITIPASGLGSACANGDTIAAYPNITLTTALAGSGASASDSGTVWPTAILSQASSSAIATSTVLTYTTNATNYTTGSLNVTGGITATGDAYVGQGVYNSVGNLIRSPNSDSLSLAIGNAALANQIVQGIYGNVAVGPGAMSANTLTMAAIKQTAVGFDALERVNSGARNTAVGYLAMTNLTTGSFNTAVGQDACGGAMTGNDNICIGDSSGIALGAGAADNVLFGFKAGNAITTNSQDTMVGSNAGLITTGGNNTILGYNVGSTILTTGTNNILIGVSSAVTTAASGTSNTIQIGGTGASGGSGSLTITGTDARTTEVVNFAGELANPTGGLPTCGTGCSSVTAGSTNVRGSFVTGSSISAATLNWSHTLPSTPVCTISDSSTTAVADISTLSTTVLTVSLASAVTSATIYYICLQ